MPIDINKSGFNKAIAIISDRLFEISMDKSDSKSLKRLKLYRARESNLDFEYELAVFICGEETNSFPYRSSYYLTKFFNDLGFDYQHDGSTRRFWVQKVLEELTIDEIAVIIEKGLFNKKDFRIHPGKDRIESWEQDYTKAISEFRDFINNSINDEEGIDLSYLLQLSVNTELLLNKKTETKDQELNSLIDQAKNRFLNPPDRQIALEKLWDAFERLKTYYSINKKSSSNKLVNEIATELEKNFIETEFKTLTAIGNEYRIRHHETGKKDINEEETIVYLYFRMLSLIDLSINKIKN